MPFSSNLKRNKSPDQTVNCLTDGNRPSFDGILGNTQNTTRHIPRSYRVNFITALSQACDKKLNLRQKHEGYKLLLMIPTVVSAHHFVQVNASRLQMQSGIKNYSNACSIEKFVCCGPKAKRKGIVYV